MIIEFARARARSTPPIADARAPMPSQSNIPRRSDRLALLGEYQGGGYREPRYLIGRGDGQMVLVSRMLNAVATAVDGRRTLEQVARHASQDCGRLLSPEAVRYLIERKLHPLGLITLEQPIAAPPRADPLLALAAHHVLLPARSVRALAVVFAPLFAPPVVVLSLCGLVVVDTWLARYGHVGDVIDRSVGSPPLIMTTLALFLAGTLFHEFGHAAGCRYSGGRPGAIGIGVMVMLPCFYTNVTDAYRLSRTGRLRTDLGGIYFNAVAAATLGAVYAGTRFTALPTVIVLIHAQMLEQLLPVVRMDGYYILGDLIGVPNLFEQIRPMLRRRPNGRHAVTANSELRPAARRVVIAWMAVVIPALCAGLVVFTINVPTYFRTALANVREYWRLGDAGLDHHDGLSLTIAVIALCVLIFPWFGLAALVCRCATTAAQVITTARQRRHRSPRHRSGQRAPHRRTPVNAAPAKPLAHQPKTKAATCPPRPRPDTG